MSSDTGAPWRALVRWETMLFVALVAALLYGASTRNFWTSTNAFFVGLNIGEVAIMALPLTLIVITGEIDLSIASMLGLASTLVGYLTLHGWSILPAMLVVLLVGCVGGALNGFLVTTVGLPSIAVTIGTLTLYRGLAEGLLEAQSVGGYSLWLTKIGVQPIPHTHVPWSVGFFLVLAIAFGVVLHATPVGRSIFAIGLQAETAQFSGIRVKRIKFELYVLSGLIASFAGILWTFRFATLALRRRHRPGADGRRHRALRRRVDLRRARLDHRRRAVGGDHRLPATGDDVAQDRSPGAQHRHRRAAPAQRHRAQPRRGHRPTACALAPTAGRDGLHRPRPRGCRQRRAGPDPPVPSTNEHTSSKLHTNNNQRQ